MVFNILIIVITNLIILSEAQKGWQNRHSDVGLNVKQLVKKYDYPFESHTVESDDGYILKIHRIPFYGKSSIKRPPILMMPGLFCSSADWINMGVNNSFGFILAKEGYDVWLANYRGTTWCKKHKNLDCTKNKTEFFDYSFQEIGYYDIPATIDYILKTTKQENLIYVGHSQGTTSFFAMLSDKPSYNKKIRLSITLAPLVSSQHSISPVGVFLVNNRSLLQKFVQSWNIYEFLPHSKLLTMVGQIFCNDRSPFQSFCSNLFYIIAGYTTQLNKTMIPVIVSNTPAGASFRQIDHYIQLRSGSFSKYDHGKEKNLEKYEQPTPPEYDLSKITVPVAMYYGSGDTLATPTDVNILAAKLPNVVLRKLIPGFNHIDVLWGVDANKLIFKDAVEIIKSYS